MSDSARRPGVFEAGDGIRAVAALSVVVYHAAFVRGEAHPYGGVGDAILGNLDVGLYLFFVLSGYLVGRPFVRAYILGRPPPALPAYLRNRLLRIVPAFWVVATILLLRHRFLPDALPPAFFSGSPSRVAAIYLFVQNQAYSRADLLVGQAWTLDIEMAFYLLLPLVALLLAVALGRVPGNRRRLTVVVVAVTIMVVSNGFRLVLPRDLFWQGTILSFAFAFMPGVALAALETGAHPGGRGLRRPVLLVCLLGLGAGALLLAYYAVAPAINAFDPREPRLRPELAALACGCLVGAPMAWQWAGREPWAWLSHPVTRWLGVRSYGIYLVHQGLAIDIGPLLGPLHSPWLRLLAFAALLLPASIAAAAVLYRAVEAPCLRLRTHPSRQPAP